MSLLDFIKVEKKAIVIEKPKENRKKIDRKNQEWKEWWEHWVKVTDKRIQDTYSIWYEMPRTYFRIIHEFSELFNPLWYKGPDPTELFTGLYSQFFARYLINVHPGFWMFRENIDAKKFNWHLNSFKWTPKERQQYEEEMRKYEVE